MRPYSPLAVAVLVLAACRNPLASAATGPLTGAWVAGGTPSGAYTLLTLRQVGSSVTGSVQDFGIGPLSRLEDEGGVSGGNVDGLVDLELRYRQRGTVRLVGKLTSGDALQALWIPPLPDTPYSWSLYRQGP